MLILLVMVHEYTKMLFLLLALLLITGLAGISDMKSNMVGNLCARLWRGNYKYWHLVPLGGIVMVIRTDFSFPKVIKLY